MRSRPVVLALVLALVSVPAEAQRRKKPADTDRLPGAVDKNPYPPPFATSEPAAADSADTPTLAPDASGGSTTFTTSGKDDAGVLGQADATLQQIIDDPSKRLHGVTYVLEGLRIREVERVRDSDDMYVVECYEPRTGASTSSFLRTSDDSVNVIIFGQELRETLNAHAELKKFPARLRGGWVAVEFRSGAVYGIQTYSIEWTDDTGRIVKVVRSL